MWPRRAQTDTRRTIGPRGLTERALNGAYRLAE